MWIKLKMLEFSSTVMATLTPYFNQQELFRYMDAVPTIQKYYHHKLHNYGT